jgi:hypothetical protein
MVKKKNAAGEDVKDRPSDRLRLGSLKGQIEVPDDFNTMGAREIEELSEAKLELTAGAGRRRRSSQSVTAASGSTLDKRRSSESVA